MKNIFKKIYDLYFLGLIAFLSLSFLNSLSAAWNPAVNVSTIGTASSIGGPVLDVNSVNNGISVWATTGVNSLIKASFYTYEQGWEPEVTISSLELNPFGNPAYTGQYDPDISMNEFNYSVAVWEGARWEDPFGDIEGIFSTYRSINGVWSSVQRVSELYTLDTDFNPENPSIDVSNSGLAVSVWTELKTGQRYIMANFLPYEGTWGTPIQLANPFSGFREDQPFVKINSSNNAVAVWKTEPAGGGQEIGASTYNAGSGLWTTVTLEVFADDTSVPKAGIDNIGNAIAVWDRVNGSLYEVVGSYFTFATGTWGPNIVIASTNTGTLSDSHVVMDELGNATAVWTQIETDTQVYSSSLPNAGVWSTPVVISTNGNNNFINAFVTQKPLSVDLEGNVNIIIQQGTGDLQSITKSLQNGWEPPLFIASTVGALYENIGGGSCGTALALWYDSNTVYGADFIGSCAIDGAACFDINNLANRVHIVFFEASTDPATEAYYIRRNGVLIAVILNDQPGPFVYYDQYRSINEPDVYVITYVDALGNETNPQYLILQ